MSKFHFVRADKVPDYPRLKGEPSPNERTFDSSPSRAICMGFGYSEKTFRLELVSATDQREIFDVYAAQTVTEKSRKIGVLTSLTDEAIWAKAGPR